jgi:hypothetical protein
LKDIQMPKSSVADFDSVAADNTDIGGINIAEGCPAAGMNNAFRELMAQIATWRSGAIAALLPKAGGTMIGDILEMGAASTVKAPDGGLQPVGYRNIPSNPQSSSYVLVLADVGKCVDISGGGVTVPPNASAAFIVGDTIAIYNNSASNLTITQGSGVTLRLAGTATTGSRTLAQRGWASVRKLATNEWVASGSGLS